MRAALIALSAVALVHAEQDRTPTRDSSRPAQSSVARIRGRVIAADTGQPLGRAQVAISSSDLRRTLTDADGRYEFADVPAGTFQVTASKTGYVTLQHGQRRPFEPGRSVALGPGQTLDRVDFALPRGAVIAARITDDLGFPMAGVEVRVQRYQYRSDGQRSLAQISSAIPGPNATDDRGELRVFGLMPGEYVVSAVARFLPSIGGGAAGAEGYVPTFYPGVISASQATSISVGVGEERAAQFAMVRSRLARISGMVVDVQGRPANGAHVMLGSPVVTGPGSAHVGVDGTFAIGNVAPGDYALMVTYDAFEDWPQTLSVDGADISGLRLVVGGGATISGRVVFEGGGPSTVRPSTVRATVWSATPPPAPGIAAGQKSIGLDDEGRFQIRGMNGRVIIGATPPQGWTVKSVVADGRDVSDEVIDLGDRARLSDVTVTLTNRVTTLSGQVTDERAQPVSESVVVIVPVEMYHPGVMSQRVKVLRPGPSGTFTAQGMRPGRYVAVAVGALEDGRHFSPELQQQVRRLGQEFTLGEGQRASLNLRLTPEL
jgi:hypothetical protein